MTDEASIEAELAGLCAREGLTVRELLAIPAGGSRFLARVNDSRGRDLFLKRGSGLRGNGETRVLQAYSFTGHVPGDLRVLDEATFLCDWIDGVTLEHAPGDRGELLRQCGAMLKDLHAAPMPPGSLMPIRERASPEWVERDIGLELPPAMTAAAGAAARELTAYDEDCAVVLHGDVVPGNILVTSARNFIIDPIGFSGPPGWDVAQLGVALKGRDRRENLADVVAGYGERPENLNAAFAYLTFVFLARNTAMERERPGSRTDFVHELGALATSLLAP